MSNKILLMLKAIAPTRISFLGGGTDVGEYRERFGGLVLSLAISLRQHIDLYEPSDELPLVLRRPPGASDRFYKAFFDTLGLKEMAFDAYFDGEITGGIGSSASAAVALLGALSRFQGVNLTRSELAELAWRTEVQDLNMFGGKQDQYAATFGGLNAIQFKKEGTVEVTNLSLDLIDTLLNHLMLFHTPNRVSTKIQEGLKQLTPKKIKALDFLRSSVIEGIEMLKENNIEAFGNLMKAVWQAKKDSNDVSNPLIDEHYHRAIELGALGGKLMGSGGGGYMFFLVPPDKQFNFRKEFCNADIKWVDFSPDQNGLEVRKV